MKNLIILFLILFSSITFAEEIKVIQAGKSFIAHIDEAELNKAKNSRGKYKKAAIKKMKIKEITIKSGDTVTFYNKDTVTHNVFGSGFNFNQKVGSINKKVFTKKGTRMIRCAIHPKMKLKVHVK